MNRGCVGDIGLIHHRTRIEGLPVHIYIIENDPGLS